MSSVRETGVVITVKDAFGFIRCAEREEKLFFHFSSMVNTSPKREVDRGDEVSFVVLSDPETKRLSASQVLILPPGTVVFEEVSEFRSRGVIERELQIQAGSAPGEPFGGRIRAELQQVPGVNAGEVLMSTNGPYVVLEFSGRDVSDVQNSSILLPGDIVEFQLFTEKRSSRQGATNIVCIRPAERLQSPQMVNDSSNNRETGVVVCVKDSYGFIRCFDRDQQQMFFHFSELINSSIPVHPGLEVSFCVGCNKKNQIHATQVMALQAGTLAQQKIDSTPRRGVVSQGISVVKGPKAKRVVDGSQDMGNIEFFEPDDGDEPTISQSAPISRIMSPLSRPGLVSRTLSFGNNDVADPRFELIPGDEVEFKVATHLQTRASSATGVVLLVPSPIGRERGIVTVIKPQYGFIKCELRQDPLFFHFSEIFDQNIQSVAVGDEVEFNVHVGKDQLSASRLTTLPAGTVKFDTVDLRGTITKEAGSRSAVPVWGRAESIPQANSPAEKPLGTLQLNAESAAKVNLSVDTYVFSATDFLALKTAARAGDEVEFAFRLSDPGNGKSRISHLRLVPKKGIVESVYPGGGSIRVGDESVAYSLHDVIGGVVLRVNDEVLVGNLTYNARKKQRIARSIERTKEATVTEADEALARSMEQLSSTPRVVNPNVNRVRQVARLAQGPDGTNGFKPGSRSGL
uniref:CSD domain-containing protein n=1 Tax=Spongospora subterranea TaxID=70186 RepID=A0A0H5R4Q8_9EUKA|eukprot:CRZ09185.1 hypothetical protein [Spongospora subterranea]